MAWRIVKQPDGLYALFADPVDDFTIINMTRAEALDECLNHLGRKDAATKVAYADANPGRWKESLATIRNIHRYPEPDPRIRFATEPVADAGADLRGTAVAVEDRQPADPPA